MKAVLDAERKAREERQAELDKLMEAPTAESRTLTAEEDERFEALVKDIKASDKRIKALEDQAKREAKSAEAAAKLTARDQATPTGGAKVKREEMMYTEQKARIDLRHGGTSFLRDFAAVNGPHGFMAYDRQNAEARLQRHQREMEVELRELSKKERRAFDRFLAAESGTYEQRTNPNTTAGTGGEFVPPLWLISQYVPFVRAGRVCANRCRNMPLPPGIDVINLPKITTGSLTGIQATQGTAVTSQDIVTSSVSANVNTIAGQEDISLQLLEQSPIAMDGVVFDDLTRDYDKQLDTQVLAGSGSNGQHRGVFNVSGATSNTTITNSNYVTVGSATFHDASTANTQYRSILNGINQIETLRFAPATAIWAHPRRVNSWRYVSDTTARPLFVAYSPYNALGQDVPNMPQGVAGELAGLPVVKDANIPTTFNGTSTTGGTADGIVVLKEDDLFLWEGTMRLRTLPEILSGTLQIRFQCYAYSAFLPSRFPVSLSLLTGNTGLAAPGF